LIRCGQMNLRQNHTNTINVRLCPISVALIFMARL
jgi:hypothetical protein